MLIVTKKEERIFMFKLMIVALLAIGVNACTTSDMKEMDRDMDKASADAEENVQEMTKKAKKEMDKASEDAEENLDDLTD